MLIQHRRRVRVWTEWMIEWTKKVCTTISIAIQKPVVRFRLDGLDGFSKSQQKGTWRNLLEKILKIYLFASSLFTKRVFFFLPFSQTSAWKAIVQGRQIFRVGGFPFRKKPFNSWHKKPITLPKCLKLKIYSTIQRMSSKIELTSCGTQDIT